MAPARTAALLTALVVLLAGCSAGLPGGSGGAAPTGTVSFYVSDQPAAIEDFAALNVTLTEVAFHPKGNDSDDEDGWINRSVDGRVVDLTELVGENATLVDAYDLPAGEYNGVVVRDSAIEGTLAEGGEANVTLPSDRLRLNTHFVVEADAEVDFVFDIGVVETGNGRYLIKPVISESGTNVPIRPVGGAGAGGDDADDGPAAAGSDGGADAANRSGSGADNQGSG